MSRIRSIHPGQWTDEDFVECSLAARLLCLGLRNEADDNGVFEWRPTRLKMRLFPADDLNVAELLSELEARGVVLRYSTAGREYGAIRNFRVFQNPRSPKAEHPISAEADAFVGERAGEQTEQKRGVGRPRKLQDGETVSADAKPFPQNVEKNSEMERRGEKKNISPSDSLFSDEQKPDIDDPDPPPRNLLPSVPNDAEAAFAEFDALRREYDHDARTIEFASERRKLIASRLRDIGGLVEWRGVLAMIRGSPFLRGETSNNGFVKIDWLLKPANLRKVQEGNYDERHPTSAARGSLVRGSPIDALSAAIAASGLGR